MPQRLLHRLAVTLLFIAASAVWTSASAQFSPKTSGQGTSVVTTPYVRAELMAHAPQGVAPGQPLWLGLSITHQPEWHTYWKNPGDSGLPTDLAWTLPAGLDAGEIAWPLPRKIPIGTLANYGYEGTVLLPVPVTVAGSFAAGPLARDATIKLRASWLVCRKECIPEEGEFTLQLPLRSTTALNGAAFEAAAQAQPRPVLAGTGGIVPDSQAQISDGNALQVSVQGLPVALRGKTLDLFPETAEVIDNAASWKQAWNGTVWTAQIPLSAQRSNSPTLMPVVLAEQMAAHATGPDTRTGYRAELKVLGTWPPAASVASVSPALEAALKANAAQAGGAAASAAGSGASPLTLAAALLGALLGGLILNLMPCVFPVLAIKVVGFTRHAQDRRAHRLSGMAYAAGVVLSFMLLGALMLGLRAAGEAIGWGFQLQSPAVVASLAALFTLIALNLAGVFEFGQFLPSSVASLQARHPVADSFLTGVLAVAVASPCTAPFMGASLGLTATLPAPQALAVFAALGLGLALPFLAASFIPAVARALPRPGAWMDTFRKLMAFPMLATVVWLVWVLGQQSGIDGAGALLILLVGLSLVVWALSLAGRARVWMASVSIAAMALLVWAFAPHITTMPATQAAPQVSANGWQPWAPGAAEQIVATGRPVFVDFTAAWCVTCQYNKKTTLADADVIADLQARNVALLRADWTRRDPDITAALAALGRSGVPVYVFYRPGKPPVVLTEVLSVDEVRSTIAQL
ncbi:MULTISPECIES: protein-disulfide reductase DsbD [unclassified Acidovorax]|uniref:protein-disulfide reductase DsbD family protein n=1 Tax=unclassified Acidovorax TaxID=2684926 RepID=UPI001C440FE3|nr:MULTISPECIES: thioredoxin family protein [unclassified Acidovorax]MBV7430435.1 thioredoxin family protein [Acidovorax sp. sif0732]MBV7451828.1 thioredoxin family protein [Acidovorax sp. sif0715]